MAVQDDQLAKAGRGDGQADFRPGGEQGFGFVGQGAGKAHVFRAEADCLRGQKDQLDLRGDQRPGGRQDAFGDQDVGRQRQMRAVLLDGADGKYRNGACRIERGDIKRRQMAPRADWHPVEIPVFSAVIPVGTHTAGTGPVKSMHGGVISRPSYR